MKKQIRLLSLLLSLCLVLGALTACGGTAGESDQGSAAPAEASAADASETAQRRRTQEQPRNRLQLLRRKRKTAACWKQRKRRKKRKLLIWRSSAPIPRLSPCLWWTSL